MTDWEWQDTEDGQWVDTEDGRWVEYSPVGGVFVHFSAKQPEIHFSAG